LDSAHQKPLKTAKTVPKAFDGSQNADLCNLVLVSKQRDSATHIYTHICRMQGTWPIKTMAEDMDSTYISHHNGTLTLTIHYPGFQIYPFVLPLVWKKILCTISFTIILNGHIPCPLLI